MGNIQQQGSSSSNQDDDAFDIQLLFGWCTGASRRDYDNEDNNNGTRPKPFESPQKQSSYSVAYPAPLIENQQTGSAFTRTPRSVKKSTAELAEVAMSEGKTKQRYLTHASLDDAFAEGLITADDYAQKLRRLDSLQNTEEEEREAIKLSSSPFVAHYPTSPIVANNKLFVENENISKIPFIEGNSEDHEYEI